MSPLERFAREVLEILEEDFDWNADTLDRITRVAYDLGLAKVGEDAEFLVVRDS